jgi:hypothetical protein
MTGFISFPQIRLSVRNKRPLNIRPWTTHKTIVAFVLAAVLASTYWLLAGRDANVAAGAECGRRAVTLLNQVLLGEDAQAVLSRLAKAKIHYVIWRENGELSWDTPISGPSEVHATVSNTGFIVGRAEKIVLDVDNQNRITKKECVIVLTGP